MTAAGPHRFPPEARHVRLARQHVRQQAGLLGAAESLCDAAALVIDELANNAVEHGAGYRQAGAMLSVDVAWSAGRLSVEFIDPEMPEQAVRELAAALQAAADGMPSLENERGRGLFLISIYMEEVRVEVAPGGGLRLLGKLSPS